MTFAPKTPERQINAGKRMTSAVVTSVMAFASKCSKQASRVSKKLKPSEPKPKPKPKRIALLKEENSNNFKLPQSPKKLFSTISNKAITLVHGKRRSDDDDVAAEEDFGDGGVWQRSILMGDKCQPLDFSGVIYYDSDGKQMRELPIRSPRASPLPSYLDRVRT